MCRLGPVDWLLTLALGAVCLVAGLVPCAAEPPTERLFPPPGRERTALLMREIESPTDPTNFDAMPPSGAAVLVANREYRRASHHLEELSATTMPVDAALVAMARKGPRFDARCRAAWVLTLRRHPEAMAILSWLVRSDLPGERYVAWDLCSDAAEEAWGQPVSPAAALEHLAAEKVSAIVDEILEYLETIRAQEALPILLEWTRAGHHSQYAVKALGALRAAEAVPAIIAAEAPLGWTLRALGRIGTREAVDYVLAHIREYGAMSALVDSRDPRALPAVEAELARLRALPEGKRDLFGEREAQLGLIRLRFEDPTSGLLDLAENPTADLELRRKAVVAVRQTCPRTSYETRLIRLYARETDPSILEQCMMAFGTSRARGVTEAMLHHAQCWKPYMKSTDPIPLVRAISRRLGTTFASLDEVRALATARGIR